MTEINNHIYDDLAETWWDEKEFLHLPKVMVNPSIPKIVLSVQYRISLQENYETN